MRLRQASLTQHTKQTVYHITLSAPNGLELNANVLKLVPPQALPAHVKAVTQISSLVPKGACQEIDPSSFELGCHASGPGVADVTLTVVDDKGDRYPVKLPIRYHDFGIDDHGNLYWFFKASESAGLPPSEDYAEVDRYLTGCR